MSAAQGAAQSFVELLDVRHHRAGLASFASDASIGVPLTESTAAVIDGIRGLLAGGETNIAAALQQADKHLDDFGRPATLPVIVLLTDGRHNAGTDDPRTVAAAARARGVQIYTVGLGEGPDAGMLIDIAGTASRYYSAPTPGELFPIYGEILRAVLSSLAGNVVIDDKLGPEMAYVTGSARPIALAQPDRLRWGRSLLPSSGLTLTYAVQPKSVGRHVVNEAAVADYTDADGQRRRFVFPVPQIEVVAPTVTPTVAATATSTPTPAPPPIFLPIAYRLDCLPGTARSDVVLVVDISSSMAGVKLEQAKVAALEFIRLLDLPLDQASIVGFHATAHTEVGLTGDEAALTAAVMRLETAQGTRIDRGVQAAAIELLYGAGRNAANRPVLVLLSDGGHAGTRGEVLGAVADAKSFGVQIYAVGLGEDADLELLEAIGGPGRVFHAREPQALTEIYRGLAIRLPCR
jgi:Mg-chelatase subunit ChlD